MTDQITVDHGEQWSHAQCTCIDADTGRPWHGPDRMRWQTALDDAYRHCGTGNHNWAVA